MPIQKRVKNVWLASSHDDDNDDDEMMMMMTFCQHEVQVSEGFNHSSKVFMRVLARTYKPITRAKQKVADSRAPHERQHTLRRKKERPPLLDTPSHPALVTGCRAGTEAFSFPRFPPLVQPFRPLWSVLVKLTLSPKPFLLLSPKLLVILTLSFFPAQQWLWPGCTRKIGGVAPWFPSYWKTIYPPQPPVFPPRGW